MDREVLVYVRVVGDPSRRVPLRINCSAWQKILVSGIPVNRWRAKWDTKGETFYVTAWFKGKTYYLHRLLLDLPHGDPRTVDHADHDGLNNTEVNIGICTHRENLWNQRVKRGSGSQEKSIYKTPSGTFRVQICSGNAMKGLKKTVFCKTYGTIEEARQARDEVVRGLYGKFACVELHPNRRGSICTN